ncbi:MAG: class I SAM-dependent methyltransferase, partial [Bacillati bacterium]
MIGDDGIDWNKHWSEVQLDITDAPVDEFKWCKRHLPKHIFAVCELGCGPARYAHAWKSLGGQYYGIDLSNIAIAKAKSLHLEISDNFIVGENINISMFGRQFDVVFTNAHLQHVLNSKKVAIFKNVEKCLKPDGIIVLKCEKHDVQTDTTMTYGKLSSMFNDLGFK